MPEELVQEFSTRARHIDAEKNRLIAEYVAKQGRQPSTATVIKLRAKPPCPPGRRRRWARGVADNDKPLLLRADDVPLDAIAELSQTWSGWWVRSGPRGAGGI